MGLLPHEPHNLWDILPTNILKQTCSYEQASYAILKNIRCPCNSTILDQVWVECERAMDGWLILPLDQDGPLPHSREDSGCGGRI